MSIKEQRRAAFEAWVRKEIGEWPGYLYRRDSTGATRAGQYVNDAVESFWIGWNAALDSVVIELPEMHDLRYHGEFVRGMRVSARRIEEAGLKVKA